MAENGEGGAHKATAEEIEALRLRAKQEAAHALHEAAALEGAWSPVQVGTILTNDRVRIVDDPTGLPTVRFCDRDGIALLDGDGQPITDARALVRQYLDRPENRNLLSDAARQAREARDAERRDVLSRPISTQEDFFRVPPHLRDEALDRMTPRQRLELADLAKPDPEAEGYL